MRFAYPYFPAEFDIPDDWWIEADMPRFTRRSPAYRSTATQTIPLSEIEPPFRLASFPKDYRGFDRARMVSVLKGFVADAEIEPVPVLILPPLPDISTPLFAYRVLDGMHRFYASVAVGFEKLPVAPRKCCQ